ncbi:DNA repair protein RadC [Maricaulis sp.]|uniref:JAB domain-containing protein n=1 Tax=Maricaulis sp. TaxID=1486257 RepID=UPI00261B5DD8|nr:DNA repair protein RadC [Maricaulis sp.]MDF1770232.1 DNA repair protein RadC [Maricaulis sp.]
MSQIALAFDHTNDPDASDVHSDDFDVLTRFLRRHYGAGAGPHADRLLRAYYDLGGVAAAAEHHTACILGLSPEAASDLALISSLVAAYTRDHVRNRDLLSSFNTVVRYLKENMQHHRIEHFRALFLDRRNHLLADEILSKGDISHAPVYPRDIVKKALNYDATAVILAHNHPSGDPTPSQADINMSKDIIAVLKPLDISVHDSLILARNGHTSLRGQGLL